MGEAGIVAVALLFLITGAVCFFEAMRNSLGNKSPYPSEKHANFSLFMSLGLLSLYGLGMALSLGYGKSMWSVLQLPMLIFLIFAALFFLAFKITKKKLDGDKND